MLNVKNKNQYQFEWCHMKDLTKRTTLLFASVLALLTGPGALAQVDKGAEAPELTEFKPPPRSIKDVITAVENGIADETEVLRAKQIITLAKPDTTDAVELRKHHLARAEAYQRLGDISQAIEEMRLITSQYLGNTPQLRVNDWQTLGRYEQRGGNMLRALEALEKSRSNIPPNLLGNHMLINRLSVAFYAQVGNFEAAEKHLRDAEGTMTVLRRSNAMATYGKSWESDLDGARGIYFMYQGRWVEAERSLRRGLRLRQELWQQINSMPLANDEAAIATRSRFKLNTKQEIAYRQIDLSTAIMMQGRLVEAEVNAREGLATMLEVFNKNSTEVGYALSRLTRIIGEQGRASEAVLLAQETIKTIKAANTADDSFTMVLARKILGSALVSDRKFKEADAVFEEMRQGIEKQGAVKNKLPATDLDWVIAMLKVGKAAGALDMTQEMLAAVAKQSNFSESRLNYLQAFHAMSLHASAKDEQAREIYRKVMPALVDRVRNDAENQTGSNKQQERMVLILEDNISLLAKQFKAQPQARQFAAEAFSLADLARGSSVQRALNASAARANIKDAQLAVLARKEQDTHRRIGSLEDVLTGLMGAPPEQQLPVIQGKLKADIATLKADREKFRKEIEQKFPDYSDLVNPKPATIDRTQQHLKPDEVLVSWYFGEKESFVWAITKAGMPLFHAFKLGRAEMAQMVGNLRKSLDAGVATIDEIPAFDVNLSHALFKTILEPVLPALNGKKAMLTVPHAELGQLPLALLVTQAQAPSTREKGGDFMEYRQTAWLIKDIAVAQLPSVTALVALRNLPAPPADRRNFVGFGDPFFSLEQAKIAANVANRAANAVATRGMPLNLRSAPKTAGVSSAELALLPRLPDTNEELIEIGKSLSADPSQDIFLNKDASVSRVMEMDLSKRQVVMFATHGLVPGELDGLSQPALALSSPEVTGEVKGDGLLTMEKILTLKLNADWVVLSACNTASGEGAGAEAVSGLGRAFFYAGARALLVSNWPVESETARMLMTDMFKRQQQSKGQHKAQYLQASMVNMIDGLGAKDAQGNTKYAYAHPLFWAPFVVVGD
ncbi:CHAT domain containing protein [Burkholderiaceae bacterium]